MTDLDVARAAADAPRHPWSQAAPPPDRGARPPVLLTDEQVRAYDADGVVVVPDVLDPEDLARVAAEIEPYEQRINDLLRQLDGGRFEVAAADALTVTLHLSTLSAACRDLAYGPVMAGIAHDLIGPDVRLYWDQAVYKMPHNPEPVPWHQDNGYAYVEPQQYLTCWVPLVDATLDNGTVWVVPGVHRRGTLVHETTELGRACLPEGTEGAVAVEVPAGSVLAFSSLTPHRTGPNRTDEVRSAYILQYAPDGAEVLEGDPAAAPVRRVACTDPSRQLPILVGGRHTPAPPL